MQYSSSIDNSKSVEWGLTLQEAYLFTWIIRLPIWADRITKDNVDYWFASKTKAIEDMPLISNKKDTIYRYYKSLELKGVIMTSKIDGKDYVHITKKGASWNTIRESDSNPSNVGNKSESNSDSNPTYYNNNYNKENIDNNNKKEKNIKKRKTATIDDVIAVLPPNSEQLIPCLREWMEYKLARGESYLLSTISTTVNKLLKGCEGNAAILQTMVDKSIASNYSGMFALPAFEVKRILEGGEKKSLPFPLEVKRKDMITNKWVMEEFGMDIRSIFKENGFQENHEYCKFIREHLEDKYNRPKGILFDSEEYHREVNGL